MTCSAARCGGRAVAVVDQDDGVLRLACQLHAAAVQVFCPAARVHLLPRWPGIRNGRTARTDQTNTFPDRSLR